MKAYRHLYQRYYPALVIYGMQTLNDQERCEDIAQEVVIAMWQRANNFQSVEQVESYLYNSVRNKALNEIRHEKVKENYSQYIKNTESEEDLDDQQIVEDMYAQLFHAISQLPEKQQKVIVMAMDGKSNADIAEALELSIETVKTHRKLALRKLREITKSIIFMVLLTHL